MYILFFWYYYVFSFFLLLLLEEGNRIADGHPKIYLEYTHGHKENNRKLWEATLNCVLQNFSTSTRNIQSERGRRLEQPCNNIRTHPSESSIFSSWNSSCSERVCDEPHSAAHEISYAPIDNAKSVQLWGRVFVFGSVCCCCARNVRATEPTLLLEIQLSYLCVQSTTSNSNWIRMGEYREQVDILWRLRSEESTFSLYQSTHKQRTE